MFGLLNKSNRVDELEAEVLALKKRLESFEEVQKFLLRSVENKPIENILRSEPKIELATAPKDMQKTTLQPSLPSRSNPKPYYRGYGKINIPGLLYDESSGKWRAELIKENGKIEYSFHRLKVDAAIDRWYTELVLYNFNAAKLKKSAVFKYLLNERSKKYIRNRKMSVLGIDPRNGCLKKEDLNILSLKKNNT